MQLAGDANLSASRGVLSSSTAALGGGIAFRVGPASKGPGRAMRSRWVEVESVRAGRNVGAKRR